jgi:hypothetical protein
LKELEEFFANRHELTGKDYRILDVKGAGTNDQIQAGIEILGGLRPSLERLTRGVVKRRVTSFGNAHRQRIEPLQLSLERRAACSFLWLARGQ